MNFSSLLSKEIAKKRQRTSGTNALKKPKHEGATSPEGSTGPNEESTAESETNAPKQEAEITGTSDFAAFDGTAEEWELVNSISDEQLNQKLADFNELDNEPDLPKLEKIRKVEILVRDKLKNELYQKQLLLEQATDVTLIRDEIADDQFKDKLYVQVRKFVKVLVKDWDNHLQTQVRTIQGDEGLSELDREEKSDVNSDQQRLLYETKRDLVRLLYKLRSRKLKPDMLVSLATILYYIQAKDFARANESYMKLSIGNVAWPIGIKDVGIHSRSALLRITGDDKSTTANIMLNDKTRRWITAIKRLITFAEKTSSGLK